MKHTRTALELFPKQVAVLESKEKELLIGGDVGRIGASYALRVAAVYLASGRGGVRVLLARKNESDLRRNHLEGPDGLLAMVADMQRHKACEVSGAEIRFANGSSIRWSGVSREGEIANVSEQRFDVLLFDNLEETSEPIYSRLAEIALNSAGPAKRVISATSRLSSIPWAVRHFVSPGDPGCSFLEMLPGDVDPAVVAPREVETFREFIEKVRPGFTWRRHTVIMANAIQRLVDGEIENLAMFVSPQHGKALAVSTPIPTPQGWSRMGDLLPGDEVFAGDGSVTRVVATRRWRDRPVYRVLTDDRQEIIADAAHEWRVRMCRKAKTWANWETKNLAQREGKRNPLIPVSGALQLPDADLPIPPYTLGAWLGDGTTRSASITSGDADRVWMMEQIRADGFETRMQSMPMTFGVIGLSVKLRAAGLFGNKRIPEQYFRASIAQRVALLNGLIDTDGHVAPDGQVEFCSTNEALATQAAELVHSLGVKANLIYGRATIRGRDCGPKFRVTFYSSFAARMPRKASRCRDAAKKPGRFLRFVPAGIADTACIEVEHPSHLFLAGRGCVVTCNSELGPRLGAAYQLARFPSQWIGLTSYNASTAEARSFDAREFYVRSGRQIEPGAGGIGLWRSRLGGGVWAAGIDGGQTGNPMSLGIIDDPDKSYIDALSPADRKKKRAWFGGVWLARESMFANERLRQLLIATRWDIGDTASFILQQLVLSGKRIHVVVLPAIYDPEIPAQFTDPATCRNYYGEEVAELMPAQVTVEPDWRLPGEAIDPERRSVEEWKQHARGVGALAFETTWQQNPVPAASGGIYDRAHFRILRETPPLQKEFSMLVRAWDDAATESEKADATASVLVGIHGKTKRIAVLGATEDRIDGSQVKALKLRVALEDGPRVIIKTPQDPGAAGKTDAAATELALEEHANKIIVHRPTGSKKVRARNPSSLVTAMKGEEHGQVDVYVSSGERVGEVDLRRFLDVLHRFTGVEGGDDDLADAFADAVNEVSFPGKRFSIH